MTGDTKALRNVSVETTGFSNEEVTKHRLQTFSSLRCSAFSVSSPMLFSIAATRPAVSTVAGEASGGASGSLATVVVVLDEAAAMVLVSAAAFCRLTRPWHQVKASKA